MKRRVIESYRELYEQAYALTEKNSNGSVSEAALLIHLKRLVVIDEDADRERKAKHIIDALCKGGNDDDSGQLCFEGFGTWKWEPLRLIRSDDGDLIENCKASLEFKIADAQRSGKHMEETQASYRRKQREADVFAKWTVVKMRAGVKDSELTWGACIADLGLHDPFGTDDTGGESDAR